MGLETGILLFSLSPSLTVTHGILDELAVDLTL